MADFSGKTIGFTRIICRATPIDQSRSAWLCECVLCGFQRKLRTDSLQKRKSNRATCPACIKARRRTYEVWRGMVRRCYSSDHVSFRNYGGRGIAVCDRWRESYHCFLAQMGVQPFRRATIDRIDNDGDYEPGNCRWTTYKTNLRNTRKNRRIEYRGKTKCVSEWAEEFGVTAGKVFGRLHRTATGKLTVGCNGATRQKSKRCG